MSGIAAGTGVVATYDPQFTEVAIAAVEDAGLAALASGDLNGDGGVEVVVLGGSAVLTLVPQGDGGFKQQQSIPWPPQPGWSAYCDRESQILIGHDPTDGGVDLVGFCAPLVSRSYPPYSEFEVVADDNVCATANALETVGAGAGAEYAFSCATNDAGTQPDVDVFLGGSISGSTPTFTVTTGLVNTIDQAEVFWQDLNDDGIPDLLMLDAAFDGGGGVAVRYCQGGSQGCSGGLTYVQAGAVDFSGAAFGDLNGDGAPDVAIYGMSSVLDEHAFLELMIRLPDAGMSAPPPLTSEFDLNGRFGVGFAPGPPTFVVAGDFLGLGTDQVAVVDSGGDVQIIEIDCQ